MKKNKPLKKAIGRLLNEYPPQDVFSAFISNLTGKNLLGEENSLESTAPDIGEAVERVRLFCKLQAHPLTIKLKKLHINIIDVYLMDGLYDVSLSCPNSNGCWGAGETLTEAFYNAVCYLPKEVRKKIRSDK